MFKVAVKMLQIYYSRSRRKENSFATSESRRDDAQCKLQTFCRPRLQTVALFPQTFFLMKGIVPLPSDICVDVFLSIDNS